MDEQGDRAAVGILGGSHLSTTHRARLPYARNLEHQSPKEPIAVSTTESTLARDEAEIRHLIADQMSAICTKDVARIMSPYAAEFIAYNVKPPLQIQGTDAWRRVWETCRSCEVALCGNVTPEAAADVVVENAGRLHPGIDDHRADELEPLFFSAADIVSERGLFAGMSPMRCQSFRIGAPPAMLQTKVENSS